MINLNTFANGEFADKLNKTLLKVAENIRDTNTDAEEKRSITITMKFVPNKTRSMAGIIIDIKTKLADTEPTVTNLIMDRNMEGKIHIEEYDGQIPGQIDIESLCVNSETGEISDERIKEQANE